MFEIVDCFLLPVRTKLTIVSDMIHAFIISEDCDDLIIDLTSIIESYNSDDSDLCEGAWYERLSDSGDDEIEEIIIMIPSTWDRSIRKWIRESRISDTIEFECTSLGDIFILIDCMSIDLDKCIDSELAFVSESWKYME